MKLLTTLLEKGKEALKGMNNVLVEKKVTRAYDRCLDNITAKQDAAETDKNALYEQLVLAKEEEMVEIFRKIALKFQEIEDCENTIEQLAKVKKDLFDTEV